MGVVLRDIVGDMKTYNRALAFLIMLLGLGNLFHPILGMWLPKVNSKRTELLIF